jgi:hypothetical protein
MEVGPPEGAFTGEAFKLLCGKCRKGLVLNVREGSDKIRSIMEERDERK